MIREKTPKQPCLRVGAKLLNILALSFLISLAFFCFSAPIEAEDRKGQDDLQATIPIAWLKPFQSAVSAFEKSHKGKDVSCYTIVVSGGAHKITVSFVAKPYRDQAHIRGRQEACGLTVSYETDIDGNISRTSYIR